MYRIAFSISEPARPLSRGALPSRTWLCVAAFPSALDALRLYLALAFIARTFES